MRQAKSRDVTGWYARLNAILTGHGLSGIAVPTVSGAARAAQVTPLTDKLEAMKTDTYYKYAAYSDWGQVVQGAMMRELTPVGVEATLSSIEAVIVCRNTAANNYGTGTNGAPISRNRMGPKPTADMTMTLQAGPTTATVPISMVHTPTVHIQMVIIQMGQKPMERIRRPANPMAPMVLATTPTSPTPTEANPTAKTPTAAR